MAETNEQSMTKYMLNAGGYLTAEKIEKVKGDIAAKAVSPEITALSPDKATQYRIAVRRSIESNNKDIMDTELNSSGPLHAHVCSQATSYYLMKKGIQLTSDGSQGAGTNIKVMSFIPMADEILEIVSNITEDYASKIRSQRQPAAQPTYLQELATTQEKTQQVQENFISNAIKNYKSSEKMKTEVERAAKKAREETEARFENYKSPEEVEIKKKSVEERIYEHDEILEGHEGRLGNVEYDVDKLKGEEIKPKYSDDEKVCYYHSCKYKKALGGLIGGIVGGFAGTIGGTVLFLETGNPNYCWTIPIISMIGGSYIGMMK